MVIKDNVKVGRYIDINGRIYRPIGVLVHRYESPHFWCYVNREEDTKDVWYRIEDAHSPRAERIPERNVVLVVYQRMGSNLSTEIYKY